VLTAQIQSVPDDIRIPARRRRDLRSPAVSIANHSRCRRCGGRGGLYLATTV